MGIGTSPRITLKRFENLCECLNEHVSNGIIFIHNFTILKNIVQIFLTLVSSGNKMWSEICSEFVLSRSCFYYKMYNPVWQTSAKSVLDVLSVRSGLRSV